MVVSILIRAFQGSCLSALEGTRRPGLQGMVMSPEDIRWAGVGQIPTELIAGAGCGQGGTEGGHRGVT